MQEVDLRVDCAAGCGIAEIIPRRGRPAARDREERGSDSAATAPTRGQSGLGSKSVPLQMREVDLHVDCAAGRTTAEVSMLRRRRGIWSGGLIVEPDVGEQGRETGETACTPGGEIRAVSRAESFVSHEGSGGERYLFHPGRGGGGRGGGRGGGEEDLPRRIRHGRRARTRAQVEVADLDPDPHVADAQALLEVALCIFHVPTPPSQSRSRRAPGFLASLGRTMK
ncbi:unnamed protein product [Miscanthus lutarioriparius]|uniref:Uncharacterized protein n=1 Tax=Miscanthus lutarioriparius TaxID=422564 RepID=A0A811RNN7_9POAL|nr:unnamed protein product [Miscanthus lutarioriparius]